MAQQETNYLLEVGLPIATFVLGFVTSRFTLSKKDRLDHKQRLFQNERELSDRHKAAYDEFQEALRSYVAAPSIGADDFSRISNTGDNYFRRLKEIAEAMLSENIGEASRRDNFLPLLKEATERTIPSYYDTLHVIAKKQGFNYQGRLRRENYEQIYAAIERFA